MHPFRIQPRHVLQNGDYVRRLAFCRWFVAQQPNFSRRILIGDEAAFKLDGEVNRENVTVWIGLVDNNVIGPYFYDANVNGPNYLDMINNQVVPELHRLYGRTRVGDVPRIWWVQDGAPAHRRDRLDVLFRNYVVGLGHAREWPRRSPDLTPLGFFLWGYLKSKVY